MKTLKDYLNKYYEIANNLGYSGASVEVLVQLLANATYISECEHATYMEEASIEKAQMENSKIQHCMDMMYSIYRGSAPKVYMKVKSKKSMTFTPYETDLIVSQNLKVHYLGYWNKDEGAWVESNLIVNEGDKNIIEGFLTPKDDLKPGEEIVTSKNEYYLSYPQYSNLCDLVYVKIDGQPKPVTRIFSDHILHKDKVFDLTTTGFGSRLYIANYLDNTTSNVNLTVEPVFYQYTELSDYNNTELERMSIKGMDFIGFLNTEDEDKNFITKNHLETTDPFKEGVYLIPSTSRTEINTIHYQAVKDRFSNSLLRSNSDLSGLLYAEYPNKIKESGTTYRFVDNEDKVNLYYIPSNETKLLEENEIESFKEDFNTYYIDNEIGEIKTGTKVDATINMVLYLYDSSTEELQESVKSILNTFNYKFDTTLDVDEIKSLIEKISNVKKVGDISIVYSTHIGNITDPYYFNIIPNIVTLI